MPIATPTALASRFDVAATATLLLPASGSITFTIGQLYIGFFGGRWSNGAPDLSSGNTFSHGGTPRTWTHVATTVPGYEGSPGWRSLTAYYYVATVTETIALTWTPTTSGNAITNLYGGILEIPSGFNSFTPIVQSKGVGDNTFRTSWSVTLDSTPVTGNTLLAGFCNSTNSAASAVVNPRANWTELTEDLGTGTGADAGTYETQYTTTLESTGSAIGDGAATYKWGGIVVEVAAAPTALYARLVR
jgi:hypothetical protein